MIDRNISVVPLNLLLWSSDHDDLDTLAQFLRFKRIYTSSHFWDNKVPPQLAITRNTFKRYVAAFKQRGWAEGDGNKGFRLLSLSNLFKAISKLHHRYRFQKFITIKNGSKADIKSQLRLLLIATKHHQISFMRACAAAAIDFTAQMRRLPGASFKSMMSHRRRTAPMSLDVIANAIKMSKWTAIREKKKLKKMKLLKVKKQKPEVVKTMVSFNEWRGIRSRLTSQHFFFCGDRYSLGIVGVHRPDLIRIMLPSAEKMVGRN